MRGNLKKSVSAVLALLIVIGGMPASAAATVTNHDFFPDIVINEVKYYDMLGDRESSFEYGLETFYKNYFMTDTVQSEDTQYPSVLEQWGRVAETIINTADDDPDQYDAWANSLKGIKDSWAFGGEAGYDDVTSRDHYGDAANLREAYTFASRQAKSGHPHSGGSYTTVPDPLLPAENPDYCVYYVKKGKRKTEDSSSSNSSQTGEAIYEAYAVIAHNFTFGTVVNGNYVEMNIETLPGYEFSLHDTKHTFVQHYTNETVQTAQATAQLATSLKETLSLSQSHREAHSSTQSFHIDVTTNFGTGEAGFGNWGGGNIWGATSSQGLVNLNLGASFSWTQVFEKGFSSGHALENTDSSTSTLSVSMPPYTEAYIVQSDGEGDMVFDFELPIAVAYDIDIVYFSKGNEYSYPLKYKADERHNAINARHDLYLRTSENVEEEFGVNNSDPALKAVAEEIYKTVPLSKSNIHLDYDADYKVNRLTDIRPMKNLTLLELENKRTSLALDVSEPLDVSTIKVLGLNDYNVPYYGFNDRLGSWILTDPVTGVPIGNNENEYFSLKKDAVTAKLTLSAKKAGGTAVLKYLLPEDTYVNIEQTPIDASETIYIKPEDVDNQATIVVKTTQKMAGCTVRAEGEIIGCVGDEDIDLNGENSPVSAWLEDDNGAWIPESVHWKVRYPGRNNVTIDAEEKLAFAAEGENEIRAEWETLHSGWLPVTVKARQRLTSVMLSDPDGLLDLIRVSTEGSLHTYDLNLLALRCADQYGAEMAAPEEIVWSMIRNGEETPVADPHAFSVTESGAYLLRARAGSVSSNPLALTVAPRVTGVRLNLAEFIMSSGETVRLTASAQPEGEPDTFAFESSRPAVASVAEDGTVTAKQAGTAVIIAVSRANPDARGQCVVTVVNPPEGISLSENEMLLTVDGTALLIARIAPEGTPTTVVYSSDDDSVAAVNDSGEVLGIAPGTALIRARTHNGKEDYCTVKVVEAPAGIDAPDALVLGMGETFSLAGQVSLRSRSLSLITYRSMDPDTASVDEYGTVTAVKRGETAIAVTGPGGIVRQVRVTVKSAPERISVSPDALLAIAGDRQRITVEMPEESAGAVAFSSSDQRIALVSGDGVITALGAGEAVITATAYNGTSAACAVRCEGVTPESRALRLPAALQTIESGAFAGSPARIVFLTGGTTVKAGAFAGCGDLLLVVTKDASGIEEGAFDHEVILIDELE